MRETIVSSLSILFLLVVVLIFGCFSQAIEIEIKEEEDGDDDRKVVIFQAFDNAAFVGNPLKEFRWTNLTTEDLFVPGMMAARILGTIDVRSLVGSENDDGVVVECRSSVPMFLWVDDHLVCQNGFYNVSTTTTDMRFQMDGSPKTPIKVSPRRTNWSLYGEFWPLQTQSMSLQINLTASIQDTSISNTSNTSNTKQNLLPWIRPGIPDIEEWKNKALQKLQNGWGLYNHHTLQDVILLPDGIRLSWTICDIRAQPTNCLQHSIPETVLPLPPSNKDVVQFQTTLTDEKNNNNNNNNNNNITIGVVYAFFDDEEDEGNKNEMDLLLRTVQCGTDDEPCSRYVIQVTASMAYVPARSGTVIQPDASSLRVTSHGLRTVTFSALSDPSFGSIVEESRYDDDDDKDDDDDDHPRIQIPISRPGSTIVLTTRNVTKGSTSFYDIQSRVENKVVSRLRQYQERFPEKPKLAEISKAVDVAIYFNVIYTPTERFLIAPVSRGWGEGLCPSAVRKEMEYVLFDWDNVLVAYMMGVTEKKDLAYSSLISAVRSRTAKGFIPNWSAGGRKTQDRTEPPLGAFVLEKLYQKYSESWLVDLLWDDLAIQMDWFWSNRLLDGFIALGSDQVYYPNSHNANSMQGARFESGLDNSPMYDGDFFKDGLMQLYDVGMISLVLQECESLARLSLVIGRDEFEWEQRAEMLKFRIGQLWNDHEGIFANKFPNGTFSERISPTSFYPLLSNVATDEQAESIAKHWLMNQTRFCIGEQTSACFWGLPSISADDPAFSKLGYWRGFVWGPMCFLVYSALQNYSHLPHISTAKKHLVSQMSDMFLVLWKEKGRICENYSPSHFSSDCTGDKFYHWGALTGLLSLLDEESKAINELELQ